MVHQDKTIALIMWALSGTGAHKPCTGSCRLVYNKHLNECNATSQSVSKLAAVPKSCMSFAINFKGCLLVQTVIGAYIGVTSRMNGGAWG